MATSHEKTTAPGQPPQVERTGEGGKKDQRSGEEAITETPPSENFNSYDDHSRKIQRKKIIFNRIHKISKRKSNRPNGFRKTSSDLDVPSLDGAVPVHRSHSETWNKGNESRPFCRICQGSSSSVNQLISPCNCKGTLAYVHFTCLERWLNSSSRISCELCHHQYDTQQTRRYTLWESLRLWLRHPVNWRHLQADLFILTLLSIVTIVLVLICVLSLEYFIVEGKKYGVSQVWTKGALNVFLTIVIVGYAGSMVFLIKEQLTPWYYWWTNTHNIQLRIDCNLACLESRKKLFEELTFNQGISAENLQREGSENRSAENIVRREVTT